MRGKTDTLAFTTGQRAGIARQRQIVEADIVEELQALANFLEDAGGNFALLVIEAAIHVAEPCVGLADRHFRDLADVLRGAGFGGTRHLIRPEVANQVEGQTFTVPARFGDAGTRFVGSVGGGFRVQFGDSYSVRLEVRDLVYTARVDRVDGCNLSDFEKLEAARAGNQPFANLDLSGGCQFQKFDGVDADTKKNYREDIILAAAASLATSEATTMAGIVLTGNLRPGDAVLKAIREMPYPVLLASDDSYQVASRVHDLTVKTKPADAEKISLICDIVAKHINVKKIIDSL